MPPLRTASSIGSALLWLSACAVPALAPVDEDDTLRVRVPRMAGPASTRVDGCTLQVDVRGAEARMLDTDGSPAVTWDPGDTANLAWPALFEAAADRREARGCDVGSTALVTVSPDVRTTRIGDAASSLEHAGYAVLLRTARREPVAPRVASVQDPPTLFTLAGGVWTATEESIGGHAVWRADAGSVAGPALAALSGFLREQRVTCLTGPLHAEGRARAGWPTPTAATDGIAWDPAPVAAQGSEVHGVPLAFVSGEAHTPALVVHVEGAAYRAVQIGPGDRCYGHLVRWEAPDDGAR